MENTPGSANANGFLAAVKIVGDYMKDEANPLLAALIEPTEQEICLRGLFLRAGAWMLTLRKLDNPVHVQAIVSSNRSLLETTVDIVLVSAAKSAGSVDLMNCWEESAKLHAAENLVRFFQSQNQAIPNKHNAQDLYVKAEGRRIKQERLARWPKLKGKHPRRWTGNNLDVDVVEADKHYGSIIKDEIGHTLNDLYQTEYRLMNFYVHGSALTGMKGFSKEALVSVCALGFKSCSDLAMVCTKVILTEFGFARLPQILEGWEKIKELRALSWARVST